MQDSPDLQNILDRASGQVSPQKLRQIVQRLETSLGRPLSRYRVNDPIIVRRSLVEQMRSEGASAGSIEALTQCFMGIIRRAAVDGLLHAPPEGPWTRTWQSVLDFAEQNNGVKAYVRSLGAWATERHLEPEEVETSDLRKWLVDLVVDASALPVMQRLLLGWAEQPSGVKSDSVRTERLRRKSRGGTVETIR